MMLMRRKANFSKITNMNRKVFLSRFSMAAGTTVFMPSSLFSQAAPKAEPLPPDKVKAFVLVVVSIVKISICWYGLKQSFNRLFG